MKILALSVLLAMPATALASTVNVGVLVPPTPSQSSMSDQFSVGAILAFDQINSKQNDFEFSVVPLYDDLASNEAVYSLEEDIVKNDLAAIIALSDSDNAKRLRYASSDWEIPTVVVTLPHLNKKFAEARTRNPYVVDLGIPFQKFQSDVMRQWQHCYAQDGIAILYNQGFAWSSDFATRAAKAAEGESHISTLPWSDDESTTSHKRTIGRIVRETREHPHIGIVLAGAPWNSAEWISSLATDETAAPVFIGPFTSDPTKLQQIALTSKSTIFAASQYWTNPNDKLQKKFTDDTIKRLDWSQEVLITPIALQAYDAAVLIERAYTSMQSSSQQFGERWWLDLGTIQGIKGTLDLYDDVTVSPAADLVRVDRSGTISFYPTTAACPP